MLDEQQLGEFIDLHFPGKRKLFRLEGRDLYDVGSDGGDFARYLAGEPGPDMTRKGLWMDQIRSEVARGLITYRVRVVRRPMSLYARFQCAWGYPHNEDAGERIRVLDLSEQAMPAALIDEDFWLIGDDLAVRMHYDEGGRFLGAEVVPDGEAARYRTARDEAWKAAVPFSEYWPAHPQYHRADRRAA